MYQYSSVLTITSSRSRLFKMIMHHTGCPSYLVDLVAFNTADSRRRQLRSSHTRAAIVKRTRTHFGKRAFSACGPNIWHSLPPASATLTVIQHLDELSSHIFSSVLFRHDLFISLSLLFTIDYCNAQSAFFTCTTGGTITLLPSFL